MIKSGVYQIRNLLNAKVYIGSATDITSRWRRHRSDLKLNKHHSQHLQRAWNKFGADAFVFEILEECSIDSCIQKEQYYLDTLLYASLNDVRFYQLGYNIARIAGQKFRLGMTHTDETKAKISKANRGKPSLRKGKKASQETVERLRLSHVGKRIGEYQGSLHPQAKLKDSDIMMIRQLIRLGIKGKDIAKQYSVSGATISLIKNNHHWGHINA